ncbi:YtxH domain-containing protein [Arthrobacter sp. NPDC058192]|uniref:YtxH domain-containing protein n=1 Tax=Arthrobacter sp. NPDC058192 TaxID=3346372 RepID=UPI0036F0E9B7
MKGKLLLGVGLAAGYVLGSRSGRAAYEKLKARSTELWQSKPVQDKVAAAAGAVKDKAPEVSEQLTEAARRAGTVISSAVHRDASQPNATGGSAAEKTPPAVPDPASPATHIDPDIRPY